MIRRVRRWSAWVTVLLPVLVLAPTAAAGTAGAGTSRGWFTFNGYEVRSDDLWTIATGVTCSVACGLVGCFLVLRRLSLLGDAISHAVLPGLAAAFMLSGSRDPAIMLTGALAAGLLTVVLTSGLARGGRIDEGAAMGVVFTTLFAVGVVMITWVAGNVDLDPGCVLYGLIELTPFDTVRIAGVEVPRALAGLLVILILNVSLIGLLFKELKVACFDPALATAMGISAAAVHYGLMLAVAATAVASFEAVGSILVVAMLVAPGATAHLLTDRLARMLWIAAGTAAASAVVGYAAAVWLNTSIAGMIATTALGMFLLAAVAAPRHGIAAGHLRRIGLALRIDREDVLGLLFRLHEQEQAAETGGRVRSPPLSPDALRRAMGSGLRSRLAVAWLRAQGMIEITPAPAGAVRLTESGLRSARRVVRGHRLWESYLVKHAGRGAESVHEAAHAAEHFLSERMHSALDSEVGGPADPHGRSIPPHS